MSLLMLALLAGLLAACSPREEEPAAGALPRVQLALNWFPEAEHGGFYAARVHGLYEARGVDVDILGGGPDAPVIQRVATGEVAFGVTNADDVLYARARQAPVVALMASYQVNPRCIMVHRASGIEEIGRIEGITLAMSQRPAYSHYLRWKYPFKDVRIVPYPGNVTRFLMDEDFAQQGYVTSEPFVARARGADPRALLVADIGFNPYATVLVASEETIAGNPGLVAAVVGGSVEGWEKYLDDPGPTNRRIHALNPEMSLEVLAYGAEASTPLVLDEVAREKGIGVMTLERWRELCSQMSDAGLIEAEEVAVEAAFTLRFLQ